MKNLVAYAHAVADETRWRILQLVLDRPLCVCELADILNMPQSSVSSHVQVIKRAGLLVSEKCEKWIYYRVASSHRGFILATGKFFGVSPEADSILKTDAKNAVKRLAEREESCCPLPTSLTSRRTKNHGAPKGAAQSTPKS
jgi:ArsR family transcriptional regulator